MGHVLPSFRRGDGRADVLVRMARTMNWRQGAEVGIGDGATSARLMTEVKPLRMIGVDHWPGGAGGVLYGHQEKNERRGRLVFEMHEAQLIDRPSVQAADLVEDGSLDFVFIDGDSSEAGRRADLGAWTPKVRRGGWVVGTGASSRAMRLALRSLDVELLPDDCWGFRVSDQSDVSAVRRGTVALVLGGASCVWEDMEAANELIGRLPDATVACNDVGAEVPGVDAWVSLHAEKFPRWKSRRTRNGYGKVSTYTHDPRKKADYHTRWELPGQVTAGSSGLFAAKVALVDMGIDRIILCGMPMDDRPHFHKDQKWADSDGYWPAFEELDASIRARMRSMSGRTQDLLGAPDEEFILK